MVSLILYNKKYLWCWRFHSAIFTFLADQTPLSFSDQKMSVRPYVIDFSHFPLLLPKHSMPSYQTYHKLITDVWSSANVINYIAIQKS